MSSGWTVEETRALVGVWGQANVQSELDGVTRNRSIAFASDATREVAHNYCEQHQSDALRRGALRCVM